MRAAVTGGTGFVGAALLRRLIDDGWSVSALARDERKIASDLPVKIVKGDLDDTDALGQLAKNTDVFFHLAGVTHARDAGTFDAVNRVGAEKAALAAVESGAKFVLVSSLSAREPGLSPYAESKRGGETAVAAAANGAPWVALRLPAIYGPGDVATLPYFKLIKSGFALEPRTDAPAKASLLHVDDAAAAIIAGADAPDGAVYEVGDDSASGRSWREIGQVLGETLGKQPKAIRIPKPAVAFFHRLSGLGDAIKGGRPSIRPGQANEFFHADWVAHDNLLSDATGWRAQISLSEGFAKTAIWYQENGLL